jgi:hypothetical protein
MVRYAITALGALALATSGCASAAPGIAWSIRSADEAGKVQLTIERSSPGSRDINSFAVSSGRLQGLNIEQDGPANFLFRRDAGTLDCEGTVRSRRGSGTCRFDADLGFADALAQRGLLRPDEAQSYALASLDAHVTTLDALQRMGFVRPTLDQFMALAVHGANEGWLAGIASAGQNRITVDDLIAYRIHGVTGGWLHALTTADPALRQLSGHGVIALRIHGVQPDWVKGLADAGYRGLSADDLVAMRIHGVTPEFARAAVAMGGPPSPPELVAQLITGRR